MNEVEDESVQLIITVPPEMAPMTMTNKHTNLNVLESLTLYPFCIFSRMFQECYRVLRPDGVFMFNIGQQLEDFSEICPNATPMNCLIPFFGMLRILADTAFKLQVVFVSLKTDVGNLRYIKCMNVMQCHEYWFMYSKNRIWKHNMPSGNVMTSFFGAETIPKLHKNIPSAWNEKIIKQMVETFSNRGDLLLDPLAGTGTLGKVATALDRNCILYDHNEGMREIIKSKVGEALIEMK